MAVLEHLETQVFARLNVFAMFLPTIVKLANDDEFLKCCVGYAYAEKEYLLYGDEDKFALQVAQIDSTWRDHDSNGGPRENSHAFVKVMATFQRETWEWAARFAKHAVRLRRQTQITEFFHPVVGN